MIKIVKDKEFYKKLFVLAIPIAGQNVINFAVSLSDTVMVGALGQNELSGANLADRLTFVFGVSCFGIASAGIVLASQYWGKKDAVSVRKIIAIAMRFSFILSIIAFVTAFFFAPQFMSVFTDDTAIIEQGVIYLRNIAPSYLFTSITTIYLMLMRSVEQVKISAIIYGFSFVFDVILNYLLIFGKFGFPELKMQGASLSTTITRICEFGILLYFMYFKENKVHFVLKDIFSFDKLLTIDYIKNGMPIIANEVLWSVGVSLQSVILGRLGAATVSASSIVGTISQLAHVLVFGVANAAAVIVGNVIGAGKSEKIQEYSNTFHFLGLFTGLAGAGIVMLLRGFVVNYYNVPDTTKELAYNMMLSLAFLLVFMSISSVNIVGTLRGGGDVKFGMYADMVLIWFVSFPLGWLSAFVWHLPAPIVYIFLKIDEIIKTVLCLWRTRNDKWVRNVTRDFDVNNEIST